MPKTCGATVQTVKGDKLVCVLEPKHPTLPHRDASGEGWPNDDLSTPATAREGDAA